MSLTAATIVQGQQYQSNQISMRMGTLLVSLTHPLVLSVLESVSNLFAVNSLAHTQSTELRNFFDWNADEEYFPLEVNTQPRTTEIDGGKLSPV